MTDPIKKELVNVCKVVLRAYVNAANPQAFAKKFGELEPRMRAAVEKAESEK